MTACVWAGLLTLGVRQGKVSGDTTALIDGARALRACLRDGTLGDCPQIAHFAPLQYIPALVFDALGASPEANLLGLVVLSAVAWMAITVLVGLVLARRTPGAWPVAVLLMVGGPFVWYATASFGEALAAAVIMGFAASLLLRAPWWIVAPLGLLAGLSKETAPLILVLLAIACYLVTPTTRRSWRGLARWGGAPLAGLLAAFVVNGLFNVMRYGTFENGFLLQPLFRTPGFRLRSEFATGLWFSPSQGLVLLWPAFALLVLGAVLWAIRSRRRDPWGAAGVAVSIVVLAILTVGLAMWAFPFGWIAWGPRLLLPMLPAVAAILIVAVGPALLSALRHSVARAAVGIACGWGLLASLGATVDSGRVMNGILFAPRGPCAADTSVAGDSAEYFACMRFLTWDAEPVLPASVASAFSGTAALIALAGLAAIAFSLLRLGLRHDVGSRAHPGARPDDEHPATPGEIPRLT